MIRSQPKLKMEAKQKIELTILCAEHLPAADKTGSSDPYVKVIYRPDSPDGKYSKIGKTKIVNQVGLSDCRFPLSNRIGFSLDTKSDLGREIYV